MSLQWAEGWRGLLARIGGNRGYRQSVEEYERALGGWQRQGLLWQAHQKVHKFVQASFMVLGQVKPGSATWSLFSCGSEVRELARRIDSALSNHSLWLRPQGVTGFLAARRLVPPQAKLCNFVMLSGHEGHISGGGDGLNQKRNGNGSHLAISTLLDVKREVTYCTLNANAGRRPGCPDPQINFSLLEVPDGFDPAHYIQAVARDTGLSPTMIVDALRFGVRYPGLVVPNRPCGGACVDPNYYKMVGGCIDFALPVSDTGLRIGQIFEKVVASQDRTLYVADCSHGSLHHFGTHS